MSREDSGAVDSNKLEYGFSMIYAGFPSFFCFFGIRGRYYSNFLASTGVSSEEGGYKAHEGIYA